MESTPKGHNSRPSSPLKSAHGSSAFRGKDIEKLELRVTCSCGQWRGGPELFSEGPRGDRQWSETPL